MNCEPARLKFQSAAGIEFSRGRRLATYLNDEHLNQMNEDGWNHHKI